MVADRLVEDGPVGTSLAGENRVQGLDGLVGAHETRGLDELAEQLAAEQPVVLELLVAALEDGDCGRPVGAGRPRGREFEALE